MSHTPLSEFFDKKLAETTSTSPLKMGVRPPQNDTGFRKAETLAQIAARRKRVDAWLKKYAS